MKKLLLLAVLALSACSKDNVCSVCTLTTEITSDHPYLSYSDIGVEQYKESETENDCSLSVEAYEIKAKRLAENDVDGLNAMNPLLDIDPVTGEQIIYNLVTEIISFECSYD